MHEIARPGNLALLNITSYQAQTLQCLYSSGALIWLGHMECDRSVETTFDALDQWCLRRILRVPYTARVTNVSVRSQTNQPPASSLIQQRRLKLCGHIARAAASEYHSRALRASIDRLPVDCRRPRGRPRQSWLRTIDSDLKPLNLGLHSALRRATDRPSWRRIVETAMLFEHATG